MEYLPILLTASVSTRGMVGACFNDEERYNMYLDTLKFYINTFFIKQNSRKVKLVFVDNSGWCLKSFSDEIIKMYGVEILQNNIELISLNPKCFDVSKGKGYNELLMINMAIESSRFIKEAQFFFKVTGRYPILNLQYFHKKALNEFDKGVRFYCDIKDHSLYKILGLDWNSHSFEARLWGSEINFYKDYIGEEYRNCNDYEDQMVENVVFEKLKNLTESFKHLDVVGYPISVRFKREASFGGLEGSNSSNYAFSKDQQSPKNLFKRFIGNVFRVCIPRLKF